MEVRSCGAIAYKKCVHSQVLLRETESERGMPCLMYVIWWLLVGLACYVSQELEIWSPAMVYNGIDWICVSSWFTEFAEGCVSSAKSIEKIVIVYHDSHAGFRVVHLQEVLDLDASGRRNVAGVIVLQQDFLPMDECDVSGRAAVGRCSYFSWRWSTKSCCIWLMICASISVIGCSPQQLLYVRQ